MLTITSLFLACALALSENPKDDNVLVPIFIHTNPGARPNRNEIQLIEGYADPSSNLIVLTFSSAVGIGNATFYNLTSNISYELSFGGDKVVYLPVNLSEGEWEATFFLSNGSSYIGEFII